MTKKDDYWEKIFQHANFDDERRRIRAMKITKTIENSFERGASAALPDHGSLKAASLFVNSASVTPQKTVDPFIKENMESVTCDHVLIAEDTTEMNFSWRTKKLEGLGPVGNNIDQGFFLHPGIIIDPCQESVLGLAGINLMVRDEERDTTNYKSKPIEEKESYRWLSLPEEARGKLPESIHMTVVADREGDIFDLFHLQYMGGMGKNSDLLVRACRDRKLEDEEDFFFKTVDKLPIKGHYELKVNSTKTRTARRTRMEVRYDKITMKVPKTHPKGKFKAVPNVYVIDVREINPPDGEEAIHWTLLTTWKVDNLSNALEKVRWYSCRWFIEELFRILKSGYKAEKVQFNTGHALMNWCALRLMMAVRLLGLLTQRDVETPDSALPYFSPEEIKILKYNEKKLISPRSKRYRPPKKSLAWAVLILAIMGGYKATPSALPPGQTCLWRGLDKLESAVIGFLAAQEYL
jgi:hypothetical protein